MLIDAIDKRLLKVNKAAADTEGKKKFFEHLPQWQGYLEAKQNAIDKVGEYKTDFLAAKHDPGMKACEAFHKARETLAGPAAGELMRNLQGKKPKEVTALVTEYCLSGPPNPLVEVGKVPGGKEVLDGVVKNIGSKAKTDDEKKLVAGAIACRCSTTHWARSPHPTWPSS